MRKLVLLAATAALALAGPNRANSQRIPLDAPVIPLDTICSIGSDDGRPEELFGRISSVAVDSVGTIYVLDGLAQVVRVYNTSCGYVNSFGRRGEGPGEFQSAISIDVEGDRAYVFDFRADKQIVFLTSGQYIEERRGTEMWSGFCCGYQVAPVSFARGAQESFVVLRREGSADTLSVMNHGNAYAFPAGNRTGGRMLRGYGISSSLAPIPGGGAVVVNGYTAQMTYYALSQAAPPQIISVVPLNIEPPRVNAAEQRQQEEEARRLFGRDAEVEVPERWSLASAVLYDGHTRLWLRSGDASFWLIVPIRGQDFEAYRVPDGVQVRAVTSTYLIAATATPNGAPVLMKLGFVNRP